MFKSCEVAKRKDCWDRQSAMGLGIPARSCLVLKFFQVISQGCVCSEEPGRMMQYGLSPSRQRTGLLLLTTKLVTCLSSASLL